MRKLIASLSLLGIAILGACDAPVTGIPTPAPYTPPTPADPTHPDANGVLVAIDSITWQASFAGVDYPVYGNMGWSVRDAQPWVAEIAPEIQTLVVALGTNDANPAAADGGWTTADELRWTQLFNSVPNACVAIILPYVTEPAGAARIAETDKARDWILAQGRPVVDWADYVQTPGVMAADGVHLDYVDNMALGVRPEAAAARNAALHQAVDGCAS